MLASGVGVYRGCYILKRPGHHIHAPSTVVFSADSLCLGPRGPEQIWYCTEDKLLPPSTSARAGVCKDCYGLRIGGRCIHGPSNKVSTGEKVQTSEASMPTRASVCKNCCCLRIRGPHIHGPNNEILDLAVSDQVPKVESLWWCCG